MPKLHRGGGLWKKPDTGIPVLACRVSYVHQNKNEKKWAEKMVVHHHTIHQLL